MSLYLENSCWRKIMSGEVSFAFIHVCIASCIINMIDRIMEFKLISI